MNIIKDTEEKKIKEIAFYETKFVEIGTDNKSLTKKCNEMDQLVFKLREELKKVDFEN